MTPLSPLHPARFIATAFGVGHLPGPTGTWGSLAALPVAWAIERCFGAPVLVLAAFAAVVAGVWAAEVYVASSYRKDPGAIVIDEVAGQWLTLGIGALVMPLGFWGYVAGFLLFRAADIVKPWPVSWADRRLPGGFGVVLDDAIAGVMAGIALALLFEVFG